MDFLKSNARGVLLAAADAAIVCVAYYLSYWLRLDLMQAGQWGTQEQALWDTLPWLLGIRLACGLLVQQYSWSFRHASLTEAANLVKGAAAGSALFIALCHWGLTLRVLPPRSTYVMEFFLSLAAMGGIRFLPRYAYQYLIARTARLTATGETKLRTLIFGAGSTGELILRDLLWTHIYPYEVVGFVDDAPTKWNVSIHGLRVLGATQDLPELIRKYNIDKLLVAVPSISPAKLREVIDLCASHYIKFKIVPGYAELVSRGDSAPIALKDIQLEDLLERRAAEFDRKRMIESFVDKTVLVTGAAGSIGSELCRQVAGFGVKRLVALDLNENDLYFLRLDLRDLSPEVKVRLEIASVRDANRLEAIFAKYRPEVVFHAAAHKHVPLMEHCPAEALKNNVLGTLNVARCADKYRAGRFVLISTDKAVRPANVMGASKYLAESIVRDLSRSSQTRFMAVRFGNVLGSNGSLVKILERQIAAGGPVTITHPKITRYFMTIPEAVGLVLTASTLDEGTVSVLDMGEPLSVDRIARQMISLAGLIPDKDVKIVYTGLRPGEKMYEELFTNTEGLTLSSHPKIRIAHCSGDNIDIPAMIAELNRVALANDDAAVQEFLKRHVPGYAPPGEMREDSEAIAIVDAGTGDGG